MKDLTPQEAAKFQRLLEQYFPWIGADEELDCADQVQQIVQMHEDLAQRSRDNV